jgi:intein/homing endonuclease
MGRDTPLYACMEEHPKFEDGYKMAGELRQMYEDEPDARQVIDVAKGLEGLRRQDGIHAAAVVITRDPLTDYLPIQRKPENGQEPEEAPVVTQYEMHGVEDLGLLKMDFLGLRNLDVITDTLEVIDRTRGIQLDIDNVPLDDVPTFELLQRGDSVGVFQLEGGPMRALMRSLAPTSFEDVAALVALYRPGPMAANMHNDYADRKNGRKPVEYLHADAEEVLSDTWGLMIYQEAMMRVAQRFAGYSLAEADNLRKACLPRGTRILTKSRGYVPIEKVMDLSDRRVQTIDTTAATSRFEPVDDVWSVGVKPIYRMTTSTGYTIEATAEHRFLVEGEWRSLDEMTSGDLVAVAAQTRTDGGSRVTDAEVDLAALLISEGYTPDIHNGKPRTAHFCNSDPELLDIFRQAYARHFGKPHHRATLTGSVTQLRLVKEELLSLEPILGGLGLAADKKVPDHLINAPRRKIERFLALYFCADGWADRSGVHFASKSKAICQGLKRMLLRCGIVSNVLSRTVRGYGVHHTLSVADNGYARAFVHMVSAHMTAIKVAKVDKWFWQWRVDASATNVGIPASFLASELERRQQVTGKSKRQLGVDTGGYVTCRVLHRDTVSTLMYSERLDDLRTGDLVWDTVVSIEPAGEVECFDFQMANPDRPYAVVEDFLAHNCGKKIRELVVKEREKFIEGCETSGYGRQLGEQWFAIIEPFADYAFNKSHAFGYGFVAYQTAYLKANFPAEYLAALLTSVKTNLDKAAVYLAECRAMGIAVTVPDINRSVSDFTPVVDADETGAEHKRIVFGLSAVRNVGEGLVAHIVAERDANGPYADFHDFCQRVDPSVLNKRTVESLIKAGAFDDLGHPRKGLLTVFEQIVDHTLARRRERDMGIMTLFGQSDDDGAGDFERAAIPDLDFDKRDRLRFEKEMLGLYVSDHPLLGAEAALAKRAEKTLAEMPDLEDGTPTAVGGVITSLQRKWTRKGDLMAVFTLEDLAASAEVMVFPKTMTEHGHKLADDVVVVVRGRVDKRDDTPKLIAQSVDVVEVSDDANSEPLRLRVPLRLVSPTTVEQLKTVLSEHPGESPVFLHLGERQVLRLPEPWRVDASNGLLGQISTVLGPGAVVTRG